MSWLINHFQSFMQKQLKGLKDILMLSRLYIPIVQQDFGNIFTNLYQFYLRDAHKTKQK